MTQQIVLTNDEAGMRYTVQGNTVLVEFSDDGGKVWKRQASLSLADLRAVVAAAGPGEESK